MCLEMIFLALSRRTVVDIGGGEGKEGKEEMGERDPGRLGDLRRVDVVDVVDAADADADGDAGLLLNWVPNR